MRILLLAITLAIAPAAIPQATPDTISAEQVVAIVLTRAPQQMYTSSDAKELGRLGDAAAVALTKLLRDKDLTLDEVAQVVLIVRLSFNEPRMIEASDAAEPKTALFVLKCLNSLSLPPELKQKIAQARIEVQRISRSGRQATKP